MDSLNNSLLASTGQSILAFLRFFGILIIGLVAGSYIAQWVTGVTVNTEGDLMRFISASEDPQKILLYIQGITATMAYLVFPFIYIITLKRDLKPAFAINTPDFTIFLILTTLCLFMVMPALAYLVEWNKQINLPESWGQIEQWMIKKEQMAQEMTNILIDAQGRNSLIWILVVVAVIPGIGEELLFRGILQNEIFQATRNAHVAIWIAGFLFSFIHFQFFGFFPRLLLGVLFGYFYYWSGNILIPMILHFLNNASTLIMMNLYKMKQTNFDPESPDSIPGHVVISSSIICLVLLYSIWHYFRKNKSQLFSNKIKDEHRYF
ncbi:MAG: lysostaphin resistance A-like protein [Cytophagaceae bacterium]